MLDNTTVRVYLKFKCVQDVILKTIGSTPLYSIPRPSARNLINIPDP